MRKLAWTALGFAVAAGLAEYILPVGELPYFAAALAVVALACACFKRGPRWRTRALLACLGAALGFLDWWGHYTLHIAPSEALVGEDITITATVSDYVERYDNYDRVEVRVTGGAPREKALLYLYGGEMPDLQPGDTVQAEIRVTSAVTRQGERSWTYAARGDDLLGVVQTDGLTVTGRTENSWRYFPQRLCHGVQALCDTLFPPDAAPLVKGLLTGDTADLQEDTENYTAMRAAGVLHIVAVSGVHMFVLVGFVRLLLGRSRRTSLICLPVIWLFALMAGCKPSVVRAAVMQTLLLLAPLLEREPDGITCLSAALLALLVPDPIAIGGVGLQLSFACMAGLIFLLPRIKGWMEEHLPMERRPVRYVGDSLACTLAATAFSTPLAAIYFEQVPLFSVLANLLTLSVVEAVFAAGYTVCAVGLFAPTAGRACAWAVSWLVRWCLGVYRVLSRIPFSCLSVRSVRTLAWLAVSYLAFTLWYVLRRRGRAIRLDRPVCLSLILLLGAIFYGKFAIRPDESLVTALDVGQGECVVLADRDSAVVVDCGGSSFSSAGDTAANYLMSVGKTKLDMLVLTHLHEDHANGAAALIYRMQVGCVVLPADGEGGEEQRREVLLAAQRRGVPVVSLSDPAHTDVGQIGLDLLLPEGEGGTNERGVVVLTEQTGGRALVMGDAGREAESALLAARQVPDVDVLLVGHHGSNTSTTPSFLRAADPETAIISVGYNTYGHPTEKVLARLAEYCDEVLRTDRLGDVTVRLGGEALGENG